MTNPLYVSRRAWTLGVAASAAAVGGLTGCSARKVEDDPTFEPLPGVDDVDDAFASQISRVEERFRVDVPTDAAMHGADAPLVTIVEFSDFECPFCARFAGTLDRVLAGYKEDVRLVFMQFPMPFHPHARPAASAAVAAGKQRRFWAMHDTLFAHRDDLKRESLRRYAEDVGCDLAQFDADVVSDDVTERVKAEALTGAKLAVRGTPTLFVNGIRSVGALPAGDLREVLEAELTHARGLVEAGMPRRDVYAHILRAAKAEP